MNPVAFVTTADLIRNRIPLPQPHRLDPQLSCLAFRPVTIHATEIPPVVSPYGVRPVSLHRPELGVGDESRKSQIRMVAGFAEAAETKYILVAADGFEPPTFGLCDLTHLSVLPPLDSSFSLRRLPALCLSRPAASFTVGDGLFRRIAKPNYLFANARPLNQESCRNADAVSTAQRPTSVHVLSPQFDPIR